MPFEDNAQSGLKGKISADAFHKELFKTMLKSTSAIHWGRGGVCFE